MIETAVEAWLDIVHGRVEGEIGESLDTLLSEDVVFYSPVVFTPQKGREITKLYLAAAGASLGGDAEDVPQTGEGAPESGGFRYTKQILCGNQAMLEFETRVGGKYVNGVDIIECNEHGKIIEFRVMIRPLQAINTVHAQMGAMLKRMQEQGGVSSDRIS